MKKILIINGHPNTGSYCHALHAAYKDGALEAGAEIRELKLAELNFDPNLKHGYRKRTELEPDLVRAQNDILWAEHLVLIFPQWWGMMPAILKGFFDRVLLPGFAFKYRENSALWDKLLKGRTAHILNTTDYPVWYYRFVLGEPGMKTLRKMVLDFCGIRTTRTTYVGPVRGSTDTYRNEKLNEIKRLGLGLQ